MPPIVRTLPANIKALAAIAKEERRAQEFLMLCRVDGLPVPEREVRAHPTRAFRADFLWDTARVILESEGGVHNGGRHGRGAGIEYDFARSNELQLAGFLVLRVASHRLTTASTIDLVRRALIARMSPLPPLKP